MRKLILTAIYGLLMVVNAWAQKPETVHGWAVVQHPMEWYKKQIELWSNELDKNPTNAMGWYNCYYAMRILNNFNPDDKRTREEKKQQMDAFFKRMEKAIPGSYEYNLARWSAAGFDMTQKSYYDNVVKLGKNRNEHADFVINFGEINRDLKARDEGCNMKMANGSASSGFLNYNYNVLVGLKNNAILFTCGDNDTYPAWMLQAQGVRRDVTVINLSLVLVDEYREKLFKELGMPKLDSVDFSKPELINSTIVNYFIKHCKRPNYIGVTVDVSEYKNIEDNLFLTGMAYEYSTTTVDDIAALRKNFEQLYVLDYIDKSFAPDISGDIVSIVHQNYLIPMIKLYDHYKAVGDLQRTLWIKQKALFIAKNSPQEKEVISHFQ